MTCIRRGSRRPFRGQGTRLDAEAIWPADCDRQFNDPEMSTGLGVVPGLASAAEDGSR
jgi:hypothetical protein